MKKTEEQAWLHGGVGLLMGIVLTMSVTTIMSLAEHRSILSKVEAHTSKTTENHRDLSTQMVVALEGKSGDEFDKTFIDMMIPHHQGAVEMAELARSQAKHDEIKVLADSIITSQSKEISDMYAWQKAWGYTGSEPMIHEAH